MTAPSPQDPRPGDVTRRLQSAPAGFAPHDFYGPCDAFGAGGACSCCADVIYTTTAALRLAEQRIEALEEGSWPFEWEIASRERERRKAAEQQRDALREDAARLDWLEAHPHGATCRHRDYWTVTDYDKHANNHRGVTLRAAIDAARSPQSETPETSR